MSDADSATAFAPATVGNVAVGFDILGCATDSIGDRITVRRIDEPTVRIGAIEGVVTDLPRDAEENTASVGLLQLIRDEGLSHGFEVDIDKGIPLGSGMGGSAASAVGAIVAANELLEVDLGLERMLGYALMGEAVVSGAAHGDNVTPCLYGGLTLTRSLDPVDVVRIPVPETVFCVLVNPKLRIDTHEARQAIPAELPVADFVAQSANLAGFLAGCYRNDTEMIRRSLSDMLIEPHRAPLVRGFAAVRSAAIEHGALGCSLSGSGPTMFAWCEGRAIAEDVRRSMIAAFEDADVQARGWISPIDVPGARLRDF
jgi:homoserine kinase